jgi:hypothetical protein
MTTEFYVVRHHGAWRIRVNGKHRGEYNSRVAAIDAAVTEAQSAGPGAKVFSTGIVSQFSDDWPSKGSANSLPL